jgi:hypothetical protein
VDACFAFAICSFECLTPCFDAIGAR